MCQRDGDVPGGFQQEAQRGRKHPTEGGGPPWKGHQVPVKATEGEICPPLFLLLVFLLNAIFLNHIRRIPLKIPYWTGLVVMNSFILCLSGKSLSLLLS